MHKEYDLIVFGGVCCDIVMSGIRRLPEPGEEIWADSMKLTVGGSFNVAAAAARLNLRTGLPCVLGSDMLSEFIKGTAEREGIDTSLFMLTEEARTALSSFEFWLGQGICVICSRWKTKGAG